MEATDTQPEAVKAAARRLKKRELDRRAQRVARERTKNRIAHLESLVEHFKANNPDSELSRLTLSLSQVTEQRDSLLGVLRSVEQTVQRHLQAAGASVTRQPLAGLAEPTSLKPASAVAIKSARAPSEAAHACAAPSFQPSPPGPWDDGLADFAPEPGLQLGLVDQSTDASPFSLPCARDCPRTLPGSDEEPEDVIVPSPQWPCDCMTIGQDSNTWRAANKALGKSTRLSATQLAAEDFTSQDTPVRVVLDGWDSVETAGKTSASWRKLRAIDEMCFSTCGKTERLAILWTMHLLMTYHGDASRERRALVPRWLWTRPSQAIPHSYAIDFFVWPGVRERFIFSQHQYCTNLFWKLFSAGLRILWPLDFDDCYAHDPETGRFVLSELFERRIRDINAWRMTPDLFVHFPELCGDIPVCQSIPASICPADKGLALQWHRLGPGNEARDDDGTGPAMRSHGTTTLLPNGLLDETFSGSNGGLDPTMFCQAPGDWEDATLEGSSTWPSA